MKNTVLLLAALFVVALACGLSSQSAATHAIDTAAHVVSRQPSAAELILESRQTAPADNDGRGWLGAGLLAIFLLIAIAAGTFYHFGGKWMTERRKLINAQKRTNRHSRQPQPVPTISPPNVQQVPRMRPLPQLPANHHEDAYQ